MIKFYDSISALRQESLDRKVSKGLKHNGPSGAPDSWCGETYKQTLTYSETGNLDLVPYAEEQIHKLELEIETPKRIWTRNVAGAFPCIPDYLSGLPTPMRHLTQIGDEHQPINIYSVPDCSCGINADLMQKRGITILSLVLALTRSRPVNLWYFFTGDQSTEPGRTVLCARINTSPLDLATACYVLTSAGFYRRMCMGVAESLNKYYGGVVQTQSTCEKFALELTNDPKRTLVIGSVHLNDPLISDPILWLNTQIKRFTSQEE